MCSRQLMRRSDPAATRLSVTSATGLSSLSPVGRMLASRTWVGWSPLSLCASTERTAPVEVTSTFAPGDTVYAVAHFTRLPAGTKLFARWSVNGQVREDTSELTADREYTNTYVEFHISGTQQNLPTGDWKVQLFVNGNPGPTAAFKIQ